MVKKCLCCRKEYRIKPSRSKTAKYCSNVCKIKHWRKVRVHFSPLTEFKKGDNIGKNNPNWKGGRYKRVDGYIYLYKPQHPFANCNNKYIMEHRFVMESHLNKNEISHPALISILGKRYLSLDWLVHHKDHDRSNNKIENLMLMSKSLHQSYHQKGKKLSENHKRKISQAHLGMKKPWVSILMKGRQLSSETKEKIRVARRKYQANPLDKDT